MNAVLRKVSRANTDQSFELPSWLQARLQSEYEQVPELLQTSVERAPMCLRINAKTTTPEAYQGALTEKGIDFETLDLPCALRLAAPMTAAQLPKWSEGHVAVQDYGAQLVATVACQIMTQLYSKPKVLDACAAPGGKLYQILEQYQQAGETIALELNEARCTATAEIGLRLNHNQAITRGDATRLDWWNETPFDFVLLDAPCSGTGTLRRHPDIKLLLNEGDIAKHADLQLQLVHNLWSTLAPGGTLLYCTCSLLATENDEVIGNFLASQNTLEQGASNVGYQPEVLPVSDFQQLNSGQAMRYGWQLLPTDTNTDGFYFAIIRKVATHEGGQL